LVKMRSRTGACA